MAFYREKFPWATVLPKMHILECHAIPWLKRFHVGAGIIAEQGAESIHALMKAKNKTYEGISNPSKRLSYIVNEHSIATAPSLLALRPPAKKKEEGRRGRRGLIKTSTIPIPMATCILCTYIVGQISSSRKLVRP